MYKPLTPTDYRLIELAEIARVRPSHLFHLIAWLAVGEPADQFARFAKLEQRHTDQMLAALDQHGLRPCPPTGVKRRRTEAVPGPSRSTQLPAVFQAPQEWIEYAQKRRRWSLNDVHTELDKFTNWAHANGTVKKDWLATWRNWCLNSNRPDGNWSPPSGLSSDDFNARCEEIAQGWERMHRPDEAAKWRGKMR